MDLDNVILYGYRGSYANNLYIPPDELMGTDDIDWMGISISPINFYFRMAQLKILQGGVGILRKDK